MVLYYHDGLEYSHLDVALDLSHSCRDILDLESSNMTSTPMGPSHPLFMGKRKIGQKTVTEGNPL